MHRCFFCSNVLRFFLLKWNTQGDAIRIKSCKWRDANNACDYRTINVCLSCSTLFWCNRNNSACVKERYINVFKYQFWPMRQLVTTTRCVPKHWKITKGNFKQHLKHHILFVNLKKGLRWCLVSILWNTSEMNFLCTFKRMKFWGSRFALASFL